MLARSDIRREQRAESRKQSQRTEHRAQSQRTEHTGQSRSTEHTGQSKDGIAAESVLDLSASCFLLFVLCSLRSGPRSTPPVPGEGASWGGRGLWAYPNGLRILESNRVQIGAPSCRPDGRA